MRIGLRGWWRHSVLAACLAASAAAPAGAPAWSAPAVLADAAPTPRTPRGGAPQMPAVAQHQRTSAHFLFQYDPERIDEARLQAAVDAAEAGYARCARVFPVGGLSRKVTVDLTPSFKGATGFAYPEGYSISIRVPDLDYLGLRIGYVMTHEVAHVFTYAELDSRGAGRPDAVGPWGEGLADYATGGFGDIPLADWWGRALRSGGLWVDAEWLVSGASGPAEDDFVRDRACTYAQPALLIRHLVETAGSDAFFRFYADYTTAASRQAKARRSGRRGQTAAERAALDGLFQSHFGSGGEGILDRWGRVLSLAQAPAGAAERLSLHEHVYGSIREFELRHARANRQGEADEETAGQVREEFRLANRSLREGDLDAAASHLTRARSLFAPRRPEQTTIAAWAPAPRPSPAPAAPRALATANPWVLPARPVPAAAAVH